MQLSVCRSCHAQSGASHSGSCKICIIKSIRFVAWGQAKLFKSDRVSSSQRYLQLCCKGQASSKNKKPQQCEQMWSTRHKVPNPQCRCISTERTMCAGFAARGRSGQQSRELHWSAPVKLAAVQSSPWLQSGSYFPCQASPGRNRTRGQPTHNQEQRDHTGQKRKGKTKARGGSETARDQSN